MTDEELKEALEHRDMIMAIRAILATSAGKVFFKYCFKHFEVGQLPQLGIEGSLLFDKLGFLRAGNSIFQLASEADPHMTATLFAETEKERHEQLYAEAQAEQIR